MNERPIPTNPERGSSDRFGSYCTDTMLFQHYRDGEWRPAQMVPYGDLAISPLTKSLHYGQMIFEGFKAHRLADGCVALFRPRCHLERLNRSAERLCIPAIDPDRLLGDITELVAAAEPHVPESPGSLYVRPLIFADECGLVPSIAESYTLVVLLLPVEHYFSGTAGVRLTTETQFIRSAPGGTGSAKCAGNYAAALHAARRARQNGFDEVVWLDAHERRYVEETGAMNLMLIKDGVLTTPPLGDTILPGITRDTVMALASDLGIPCREARVAVDEEGFSGITEVFSSGTAAGLTHIREVHHEGEILFHRARPGPIARQLEGALADLKRGVCPDPRGWRWICSPRRLRSTG